MTPEQRETAKKAAAWAAKQIPLGSVASAELHLAAHDRNEYMLLAIHLIINRMNAIRDHG